MGVISNWIGTNVLPKVFAKAYGDIALSEAQKNYSPSGKVGEASPTSAYDYISGSNLSNNPNSFGTWLKNATTGDLDYQRQLETLGFQNAYNAVEAQKARDWETDMSNTAYSRAANDMRSVGLNPYILQSGASTPSPVVASSGSSSRQSSGAAFSHLVGSLLTSAFSLANTALHNQGVLANTALKSANSAYSELYFDGDGVIRGGKSHGRLF